MITPKAHKNLIGIDCGKKTNECTASKPRTKLELKYKLEWLICYTYC